MSICCPCGGFTVARTAKDGEAVLRFEECGSCGRAGDFVLRVDGEIVERGQQARRDYNDLVETMDATASTVQP